MIVSYRYIFRSVLSTIVRNVCFVHGLPAVDSLIIQIMFAYITWSIFWLSIYGSHRLGQDVNDWLTDWLLLYSIAPLTPRSRVPAWVYGMFVFSLADQSIHPLIGSCLFSHLLVGYLFFVLCSFTFWTILWLVDLLTCSPWVLTLGLWLGKSSPEFACWWICQYANFLIWYLYWFLNLWDFRFIQWIFDGFCISCSPLDCPGCLS